MGTLDKFEPVAITGVGIISALGQGAEEWLLAAGEGESAALWFADGESEGISGGYWAAPIEGYDVAPLLETRKAYLDRHTALMLGATSMALKSAGWTRETLPRGRAGLAVGSAWGGIGTAATFFKDVLSKGAKFAKPILFPHAYSNTAAAMTAIEWEMQGPHEVFADNALASAHGLLAAVDVLRSGAAEVMFAGGSEALSTALLLGVQAQKRLNQRESDRPPVFDAAGAGAAVGEGAAILALEPLAKAKSRDARIYGIIRGVGLAGDGVAAAGRSALAEASMALRDVDVVFASASGLAEEDAVEAREIAALFGTTSAPPVTALAALQGDCLGAATALNVAGAALLMAGGSVPTLPQGGRLEFEGRRCTALVLAGRDKTAFAFVLTYAD